MNRLRILYNTFATKRHPISLIHFLTQRCNARCKHCFIDFDNPATFRDELTTNEIEKLTRSFGDELYSVYLTGGEPFLRKDVFEVVLAYCKNTAVGSMNIATNGMFTDAIRAFVDRFRAAKLGKRLMISISIDNFEEAHDANRKVPGLRKRALESYRLIASYHDPLIVPVIAITVAHHNYMNVLELYRSLRREGITSFIPILMREQGVVKSIEHKREVLEAHGALVRAIEADQRAGETTGTGSDLLGNYVNARNSVFNEVMPDIYMGHGKPFHCTAGTLFGVIYPNGDVRPCEVQEDFVLGNLRDYDLDFKKLWTSTKARTVAQDTLDTGCACTFDGAWSVNVIASRQFLPRLLYHFSKNVLRSRFGRRRSVTASPVQRTETSRGTRVSLRTIPTGAARASAASSESTRGPRGIPGS
jgi:MoaA/NifB/PqqE/SkfB family radical SAM enzyme